MASLYRWIRQKINRRIQALSYTGIGLILIGAVMALWNTYHTYSSYDSKIRDIRERLSLMTELAADSEEIILHSRGYYVYLDPKEYDAIFQSRTRMEQDLAGLESKNLTPAEADAAARVKAFFNNYFKDTLPRAAEFAQNRDFEAIKNLIYASGSNPVNEILMSVKSAQNASETLLASESDKLMRQLVDQGIFLIAFILLILVLLILGSRQLGKDISRPLAALSQVAVRHSDGSDIPDPLIRRMDEIGSLSRVLKEMLHQNRENEEELTAQNEELSAQQDELQAQQSELQDAISKMQENEAFLRKLNRFTRSLSQSFDKKELLANIIRQLTQLTGMEKGLFVSMDGSGSYASFGMDEEDAESAARKAASGGLARAFETKLPYARERDALEEERISHKGRMISCDLFLPILNEENEPAAGIVLTRVGRVIEPKEIEDFIGYATQIALSLSNLALYETAEGQRRMINNILDTIHEGVQVMDVSGKIVQINATMCELFGVNPAEVDLSTSTPDTYRAFLSRHVEDPDALIGFIRQAAAGATPEKSTRYRILGEPGKIIEIYGENLVRGGRMTGTLFVHRDITKEYEVDRMKSEFVSTVSHELRTPLAGILGFAELMLHRELSPDRQRKYVSTIHLEAQRLTDLINDFLDLQRIESGKQVYDMKPVDLPDLLNEIVQVQQALTDKHRLSFRESGGTALVSGDADKLRQAFVNLVGNAVKYSPDGGSVEVSCLRQGSSVRVTVRDEGLGIPEEAKADLFAKFFRVDNSDRRKIGGTGLGLAIVKEIVDGHGGKVEVESVLGEGSTFAVTLPAVS
ncbi:ATP-binding protein [Cohnella candidum]|uniref:histidine kinase n=1 Tax=Cohnella candidum TaxID=2674991 RepID=A0A3G3JWP2_9BACL|nr:ATP-binding protein [Cohnella candidum]AYQ72663.1 HAMP domain-containing protein [Cohnella candidum]